MKKIATGAFLAVAAFALPLAASADTSPLVNRVIVQQALQQQMQNQLNTQTVQLQAQQDLARATVQAQLQQELLQLQYLQLQQQLNLMNIQLRARTTQTHKTRHYK
jgi:hypothetical protein